MDIIRAGGLKGLNGWKQVMKSQVAETFLVTLMFAAAAAGFYVGAAMVVGLLD